ncbi:MAG: hypothetical protein SGJ23_02320 [Alphaproteobacteria bacterium]|nr:hypothetical protein [Alphaproteobacteria bacterium]
MSKVQLRNLSLALLLLLTVITCMRAQQNNPTAASCEVYQAFGMHRVDQTRFTCAI